MAANVIAPPVEDTILIEFAPRRDALIHALSALRSMAHELSSPELCTAWQSVDETRVTAYLAGIHGDGATSEVRELAERGLAFLATGEIDISRLVVIRSVPGASPHDVPSYHYIVRTDVAAGGETELERWYDEEHLPALAATPGVVRARRLISIDTAPRYYACYDLTSPDVLESPVWLAARATDWSARVRPTFRDTRRIVSRWLPMTPVTAR